MPKSLRLTILSSLALIALCAAEAAAVGPTIADELLTPTDLAKGWFQALIGGKPEQALALSQVPFSWDRKTLHEKRDALESAYKQVAEKKGARELKLSSVEQLDADAEKTKKLIEGNYLGKETNVIVVLIKIQDEGVLVFVKPGKSPRVVGFSD